MNLNYTGRGFNPAVRVYKGYNPPLAEWMWLFAQSCGRTDQGSVHSNFNPCIVFAGVKRHLVHFNLQAAKVLGVRPGMRIKLMMSPDETQVIIQVIDGEFVTCTGPQKNGAYAIKPETYADTVLPVEEFAQAEGYKVYFRRCRGGGTCQVRAPGDSPWYLPVRRGVAVKDDDEGITLLHKHPYLARTCIPVYRHQDSHDFLIAPLDEAILLGLQNRGKHDPFRIGKCVGRVLPLQQVDTVDDLRLPPDMQPPQRRLPPPWRSPFGR